MNIVFIGMRGSGKSTVAKMLAKKLKRKFIEMDDLVVKKAGMSIPEIVKKYGWEKFRELEATVVKNLQKQENCVIATGGGVVLKKENVESLKKTGWLIWLKAEPETLIKRIGNDQNRPSLTGKPLAVDIKETLKQRRNLYKMAADLEVKTGGYAPEVIVKNILSHILIRDS